MTISGAKNAAVAIIPAALLAEDTVRIENIPQISDVQLIIEILSRMGAEIKVVNKNTLDINTTNINYQSIPYELTSHFRASYYLIGAMLGRFSKADVALPGGCDFGVRPIDQHVKGFKMLGAQVDIIDGVVCAKAEKLVGTPIYMDVVSAQPSTLCLRRLRQEASPLLKMRQKSHISLTLQTSSTQWVRM